MLNEELLNILACPQCRGDLALTAEKDGLRCENCRVVYPVCEEIPVLLIEKAVSFQDWPEKRLHLSLDD